MTAKSDKTLFGWLGALLMFIGVLPVFQPFLLILAFAGLVLVVSALKRKSDSYKEASIYKNSFNGAIIGVVGLVVTALVVFASSLPQAVGFLQQVFPGWNGEWLTLFTVLPNPSNISFEGVMLLFEAGYAALIALWIFAIVFAYKFWKSLSALAAKTGTKLFSIAGLILLIGAGLTVLFGLGLFIMWVSALVLAVAFFKKKTIQPPAEISPKQPDTAKA
jgi:uncharacterized membrane protein